MKKHKLRLSEPDAKMLEKKAGQDFQIRKDEGELCRLLSIVWSDRPESPEKDYWTNPDMDVAAIEAKYGLKGWKPKPLTFPTDCEHCGEQGTLTFNTRQDAGTWKCPNPDCPHNQVRFPFGKFKGLTVTEVLREQPSYLAWFMDAVESDCGEVRAIKEQIEKLPSMKQHLEKYRQRQLQAQGTQRSRLSPVALDDLCDRLFNGE